MQGYEWTHSDCITVFSAPNYLGHAKNKGAAARMCIPSDLFEGAATPVLLQVVHWGMILDVSSLVLVLVFKQQATGAKKAKTLITEEQPFDQNIS